ncbi:MAG: ammonia-forming cytochrome c nitrite reductase [Bacteroidota bacterium]
MKPIQQIIQEKPYMGWIIFAVTVIVVFLIGLFASSIIERRSESAVLQLVKPLNDWEPRNEVWGENYPREYESYLGTLDTTFRSKYAGSAMIDYLEKDPELVVLWAGYAFSKGYNQGRGHYHAIQDIRNILRTTAPQPATCWTCKSTDVPRVMNKMGIKEFYAAKWMDLGHEIYNPIGCQDCHDPKTMNLRITRPALIEAFQRQGKDINKATHQEMRSLVCAQCHVEYYFKGEGKYLTFPWDKGMIVDSMEKYYDNYKFTDWVHGISRAPMLKAQHPDYEIFKTGVHADRGVACADCHMPYRSEGGVKFTNHKIQSPLNDIAGSCQVCHRESEQKLTENVNQRQDKLEEIKKVVQKTLAQAHIEAKFAWDKGATEEEMKPALQLIRHSQWRWDYVAASNGHGFHSPIETQRILATSLYRAQEARRSIAQVLAKHSYYGDVPFPDIPTKTKAQNYVGLQMSELYKQKEEFLRTVVPGWDQKAQQRQASMKK